MESELTKPGVTVVVPTLNRGTFLVDCLKDLVSQDHRPLEILVVDQSDTIGDMVESLVNQNLDLIRYFRVDHKGLPPARNFGWKNAKYEAIVFVDDDIRCGPSLVGQHFLSLTGSDVGIVAGGIEEVHQKVHKGEKTGRFNSWSATPTRGFDARGKCEVDHAPGGNFSTWKSVIAKVGGFDEWFNFKAALYEELDFCLRAKKAGYRVLFNGCARVKHFAAPNDGCRIEEINDYVLGLAHNRSLLILKHLNWYQIPIALFRLGILCLSYAYTYRSLNSIKACIVGCSIAFRRFILKHFQKNN